MVDRKKRFSRPYPKPPDREVEARRAAESEARAAAQEEAKRLGQVAHRHGNSEEVSPTAKRIKLVVSCDHCGHESLEPLPRLLAPNGIVCRECASALDLTSKENRLVIGELVKLCKNIDASVSKGRGFS